MKKFKIFLVFNFVFTLLASCSTVKEGFSIQKKNNSDEFLVEKKSPLLMPPDFNELPIPKSDNILDSDKNDEIKKLITDSNDNSSYLGYIKLQIINETANTITLNIDSNAAEFLASNGKTYSLSNSVSRAYEISKIQNNYKVNDFIPLWGDITLVEGTEVIGYLLVDLPKDVTINRLRWIASDTVTINY